MSVKIFIISHLGIGHEHLKAVKITLGKEELPLATQVVDVLPNVNPETMICELKATIQQLNQGDGVLILTDLYGATPSNIAQEIQNENVNIVTGLNLPMLLRIMNYSQASLPELTKIALKGGQAGIIECHQSS